MKQGRRSGKKFVEYCRRLKARLAVLLRTLVQSTRQDRMALTAQIYSLEKEFDEKCADTASVELGGASA